MDQFISVVPVLVLALIHFWGGRFPFVGGFPRSVWLSVAGGISVAYVFLHLFPELGEGQKHLDKQGGILDYLRHHVYLVALLGLSVFYGLESLVLSEKRGNKSQREEAEIGMGVFWVHIASFALYNALIGYILYQREDGPVREMILFSMAMAPHFIVNDYALQEHHQDDYHRFGRWVLVFSLLLGWGIGWVVKMPDVAVILMMAFIGGAVVLNVLKEELPEERESRFWAFALGAAGYSGLMLLI